nr:hypothetical protein [uncultured Carboxylicivirga sp.]
MKLYIIVALSFISLGVVAQSKNLTKADNYYNEFNYKKAIKEYKSLLKKSKHEYYSTIQIAKSYSKIGNSAKAIEYFEKVVEYPDFDYNNYFLLARELEKEKQYKEAEIYLSKYYTISKNNNYIIGNYESYVETLKSDSLRYNVTHLGFNTDYDEFSPVVYNDLIVFSSNRPATGISKNKDIRTGDSFFNLYSIKENKIDFSKNVDLFDIHLNSKYNDGPICFDTKTNTAYLTRNTISQNGKVNVLNLFIAVKRGDAWSNKLQPINLFNGNYNLAHAYIDIKNQLVYFSSDIPGGYGGMDLYVSRIKDGFLSKPTNLGPAINTIGNEVFPFIANDGTLFFTSDGLPGLGGYDIFFAKPKDNTFTRAFNMGYPINTSSDDFSLFLDETSSIGYFTSNRPGGAGGDDIYNVVIKEPLDYCLVKGLVTNSNTKTPLAETWIDISTNNGKFKDRVTTDENGAFSFYIKKGTTYTILSRKKLFENKINTITPNMTRASDAIELNIVMTEK